MILGEKLGRRKKRLGDLLIDAGVITSEQLSQALDKQKQTRQKLGATLMEMDFTTEEEIAQALKEQLGMDFVDLRTVRVPPDVISLIPDSTILKKYTIMPFEFNQEHFGYLRVAMADPMDLVATDDLSIVTNLQIEPVVATASDIMAAIDRYYGSAETQAVAELFNRERAERYREEEMRADNEEVQNSPIVILVSSMIEQAARMRASDIHIEPLETRIRVRFRIDGVLMEHSTYPANILSAIAARVKIIGGMDISEKRKPQDGRITHIVDRTEYDIRVSVLPTVYGEKIVMRLTSKMTLTREKSHLGFSQKELEQFDRILKNPNGILLVTGPTGSGKSTTLYTALAELNKENVNIITVEDPVEANIDGINQVQVNPKAELTFAAALRSILRQDPDIIMIGEIRDAETASIAVTASITGHLVVSTLHTSSAAGTISRLMDMGIEPYLIADATVGVIAQRLVRRLCDCKREKLASIAEKKFLGVREEEELKICAPCGCNQCNETGYRGRIGVYEIMRVTNRIKHAITRGAEASEIERIALADGMSTLKMSAARLVLEGMTSIAEMKRIAYSNEEQQ
ncbi:MAG: Flp pilus assembly complex ATPase component TadA [Lachnospiraceae bacterium]|jgi:type IV pilus assembly protein PilB|nr:Flp pilus assembly complex ATPase component TadA [Lachnospiraceae bacterium]